MFVDKANEFFFFRYRQRENVFMKDKSKVEKENYSNVGSFLCWLVLKVYKLHF